MRSAPTISFEWRLPRAWRAVRWASLAVGAICLAWAGLDPLAKFGLGLLGAWLEWRNLRFERSWRNSAWQLDGDDGWRWQRVDGSEGAAELAQATQLGPLLVLNLRGAGGRIDLPIWPDQLDADTRRQLRVRLCTLSGEPALRES